MLSLLAKVIPLSLGAAFSPVSMTMIIWLLSRKKHAIARAMAFLIGWVLIMIGVAVAGFILGGETVNTSNQTNYFKAYFDIAVAVLLLVLGIRDFLKLHKKEEGNKYQKESESADLKKWFVIGIALNAVNINTVLLYFLAVKEISAESIDMALKILVAIICGVIALSPGWLPISVYAIAPNSASKVLDPIHKFTDKYNNIIMGGICFLFAAYLLYRGITALM